MQAGGSPFGTPPSSSQHHSELNPNPNPFQMPPPEAAPPLNTRPPATSASNFDELGPSDDPLGVGGEDVGGGGISGNRWPRQETLALLKIRSDMDATFRDATLKGPLWEEVSRKLAELGYKRSAKKCKEKFENVHKYYKRTKEGRAGRQDGKSYRFFSQLEALHNTTTTSQMPTTPPGAPNVSPLFSHSGQQPPPPPVQSAPARAQPMQISAPTPISTVPPQSQAPPQQPMMVHDNPAVAAAVAAGISFSTNSSSSLGSESDDDDEATEEGPGGGRKRKRGDGGGTSGGGTGKMMAFFEGLMRQVMERQEAMQQRFLEAIEKREQDRMIREEAWRRQEMSRLTREHELAAQERAAAASRDAAIISFLQKVTGQTIQLPPATAPVPTSSFQTPQPQPPPPPPPQQIHHHHQQQQQQTPPLRQPTPPPPQQIPQQPHHQTPSPQPLPPPASTEMVAPMPSSEPQEGTVLSVSLDQASSSRWPKSEVHALIKLRSGLDPRYQESGPKGPLWEEISAGMQRLGYSRSAKRCKEKWENINKYFKKVKESNKKRPEDAKTCPYFHQLDALYRSKLIASSGSSSAPPALTQRPQEHEAVHPNPNPNPTPISMMPPAATQTHQQQQQGEIENKNGNGNGNGGNAEASGGGPSNGGIGSSFFGDGTGTAAGGDNSGIMKKPEDIVKELMGGGQSNNNDYGDSDNMDDEDDDEDDEDDEDGNGQFRIQFQRQNVGNSTTSNSSGGASAAPSSAGGKASGSSFLAMVR